MGKGKEANYQKKSSRDFSSNVITVKVVVNKILIITHSDDHCVSILLSLSPMEEKHC